MLFKMLAWCHFELNINIGNRSFVPAADNYELAFAGMKSYSHAS